MHLHLTVLHILPGRPQVEPVEVVAEQPEGSTAAALARQLDAHLGLDGPTHLHVGGVPLLPDHPVGTPPLVDGAAVTLVPASLASLASPASPGAARAVARRPAPAPLQLAVVHGPDAGRSYDLAPGVHVVGRSTDVDLCLADHRLSRRHAEVRYGESGVQVRDLGSTNGTRLDDSALTATPARLTPGQRLELGSTVLELRTRSEVPVASVARPDGTRAVNRRPRVTAGPTPPHVDLPCRPAPPAPSRVPWVAVLVPLPVAAVLALLLGPAMLAFALMGPLVMVGTTVNDRWVGHRRYAAQLAEYEAHLAQARRRIEAAVADEVAHLRRAHPDPAAVLTSAQTPGPRLWERRPGDVDELVVSVGRCRRRASLTVTGDSARDGAPDGARDSARDGAPDGARDNARDSARDGARDHEGGVPVLTGVPCTVELTRAGALGIAGDDDDVTAAARSLVGQLAVLHSPHDLSFRVLAPEPSALAHWRWMARLPHLRDASGRLRPGSAAAGVEDVGLAVVDLLRLVEARAATGGTRAQHPRTVVLLHGAADLRGVPGLGPLLEHGPAAGVHVIALDRDTGRLPVEVGCVLDLRPPNPSLTLADRRHDDLTVDRVGAWWVDRLSRCLAPLRDASASTERGGLPVAVQWSGLRPMPPLDAPGIVAQWRAQPSRTQVAVGQDDAGTTNLDLVRHGPHFLVAGTTGAGKSELLRTLVVSLAVHNHPAHLSLLLVDYKGGAAFRECADLPHTAGVVTDLDDRLAARALASLRAELRRREALLASAGVADYDAFQVRTGATGRRTPLPRLVIVIDEFRALAEELPDFVAGVVRVAALGRSLGIHLVLATQRPAGVVTADIKANVNGRIALRVRDRADSEDVLESPLAAMIDPGAPGRAYLRAGGEELHGFQTALVTETADCTPEGLRVRPLSWGCSPQRPETGRWEDSGGTGLRGIVEAVVAAGRSIDATPSSPAWLPPLPMVLRGREIRQHDGPLQVAIGLVDRPQEQSQPPLLLDLAAPGHWAFVGSAGSGRTTALLNACSAVAARLGPTEAHLYAVSGGGLGRLEDLPHCGAHVDRSDRERLRRLVHRLDDEVVRRRRALAASGFATLADWRAAGQGTTAVRPPPPLVLAVDDWDLVVSGPDALDDVADDLVRLLREGGAVGVRGLLSGGRGLLHGGVASLVGHRVVLRLTDPTDAALAGLPASWVRAGTPPGRGLLREGDEVQLALPGREPAQWTADPAAGGDRPFPVAALPLHVPDDLLPAHPTAAVLGLGGDDGGPVVLDPARHGRRWLVAGPPGSGVTTTLLVAARALLAQGRHVAVLAATPGPLDVLRQDPRVTAWCGPAHGIGPLVEARRRHPDLVVVVDGADTLQDHPVEAALRELTGEVERAGGLVVAGACSASLASQFRGFVVELSRHRTGVLLGGGGPGAGDVFGLRIPRDGAAPPGRALLVTRDGVVPFQVAQPRAADKALGPSPHQP